MSDTGKVNPTNKTVDDYGRDRQATSEEIEAELQQWEQWEKEAQRDVKRGRR